MMNRLWNPSTVKITHNPTGIEAMCECENSQRKNKEKALQLLRARIYAHSNVPRVDDVIRSYWL